MSELSTSDFDAFFSAIHGKTPFPWQRRLLEQVVATGLWPSLLDLPTGTGKTSVIDVALFALALAARRPGVPAARRIVMTVDRRTVVDQAAVRAKQIRAALVGAKDGVLHEVRERLASLSRSRDPLQVAILRGGIARDDTWARTPDQPLVAISTVDQVGSRLLFRGYGVSHSMKPVHAGLLGSDCLLFLDEVHLSKPFRDTLRELARYREWVEGGAQRPWQFVEMSATADVPGDGAPFRLSEEDRCHPVLRARLEARKPVQAVEVKVSGDEERRLETFAGAVAKVAAQEMREASTVGVVVNRVRTARRVHDLLAVQAEDAELFLVTGRMRPLDRDRLERELRGRVGSDRERETGRPPVIVVATQCIEAGADFDFDVLISECASLDALRQRFGRLNRMGLRQTARGHLLARSDALSAKEPDPIYGAALARTFEWARATESLDFGLDALLTALPPSLHEVTTPSDRAPVLLPAHLDAWTQTFPMPEPDPDVALWLHGVRDDDPPEVRIVWRADVAEEELAGALAGDEELKRELIERLEAVPPSSLEALSVPCWAARKWLAGRAADDFADVERSTANDERSRESADEKRQRRPFIEWDAERSKVSDQLRPDRTIVVPSTYGGLRDENWEPAAREAVGDLGDLAAVRRGRPTLRLDRRTLAGWEGSDLLPAPPELERAEEQVEPSEVVRDWLEAAEPLAAGELGALIKHLRGDRRRRTIPIAMDGRLGFVLVSPRPLAAALAEYGVPTTEDDAASFTGVAVPLRDHLRGVAEVAQELAEHCGLPEALVTDLRLAGAWHDAGKADPRFQRWLRGGSSLAGVDEPLAKSRTVAQDCEARREARRRSGYPEGARHELCSVALAQGDSDFLARARDPDLVLHLIASHHGRCRPFAPVALDREPVEVSFEVDGRMVRANSAHGLERFDSGISERFWRLVRRHGWHGLAYLESILRLADHRRSEEEQRISNVQEASR